VNSGKPRGTPATSLADQQKDDRNKISTSRWLNFWEPSRLGGAGGGGGTLASLRGIGGPAEENAFCNKTISSSGLNSLFDKPRDQSVTSCKAMCNFSV